jgi:hypothetical protein
MVLVKQLTAPHDDSPPFRRAPVTRPTKSLAATLVMVEPSTLPFRRCRHHWQRPTKVNRKLLLELLLNCSTIATHPDATHRYHMVRYVARKSTKGCLLPTCPEKQPRSRAAGHHYLSTAPRTQPTIPLRSNGANHNFTNENCRFSTAEGTSIYLSSRRGTWYDLTRYTPNSVQPA